MTAWKRWALALLPTLGLLLTLEAGVRLWDASRGVAYLPGLGYTDNPSVILYERHPYLGNVLKPQAQWHGKDPYGQTISISINSLGYRGKEISLQKPPGTFRIIALGESSTFGTGSTSDDTTYPAQLEAFLSAQGKRPDLRFEVINAGVPGYTTANSVISLSLRLLDLDPDLIVVYHAWNDLGHNTSDGFKSDYSHDVKVPVVSLPSPLEHVRLFVKLRGKVMSMVRPATVGATAGQRLDTPPPEGVEAFRRNLSTIIGIAEAHNVKVVLSTFASAVTPENLQKHPERLEGVKRYQPYLTPKGVMKGLNLYNEAITQVAQEQKIPLARADQGVPPDFDHFVDHVHLTDRGCKVLAEVIGRVILQSYFPPSSS